MVVVLRPSGCSSPPGRVGPVPPCTVTGFPPRRASRASGAWKERERGSGSAQAAEPRDSAGDRPLLVLGASRPAAEPPRPGAEVWALGGPSLLPSGPEPMPDAGRVKTGRGGWSILLPDLTAKLESLPQNSLRVLPRVSLGPRLRLRARVEGVK